MNRDKFEIIIASLPDRERLVAEIYYDNQYWVEISHENEKEEMMIQFYPHPRAKYWEFSMEQALSILEMAKKRLSDMGGWRQ